MHSGPNIARPMLNISHGRPAYTAGLPFSKHQHQAQGYCHCMMSGYCMTGSGDWRLGWQSGAAAAGPMMALLFCQLPKTTSLFSNSPSPCMPEGEAWGSYLLTDCIGQAWRHKLSIAASGNLRKSVQINL